MIPLVAPTITERDRRAVAAAAYMDALESETWVRKFEEEFAARVGCAGAVAVCSGTTALSLALDVFRVDRGEDVALPSYTCSALYNAATSIVEDEAVYLVDSTFDVSEARMFQPRSTVVVHAFGTPNDAPACGPWVVEDYTLSLGGVPVLVGRVGVCSTHASKMISTGRGGVVFSNDTALLDEVRQLAYYDSEPNGRLGAYSLGMTSMQAALGLSQLRQLDSFIERRREIAAYYSAAFAPHIAEVPDADCGSVFFRYLIGVDCPDCKVKNLRRIGIEAGRGVYPPLHQQLGLPDEDFPGATAAVKRLLSVPCHPSLTDENVAYVAEKVLEVCA